MREVSEDIRLVPYRSVRVRWGVFVLLMAFALIGLPLWYEMVFFAVTMALLVGTFPRAWIRDGHFEREFWLSFVRVHFKRWRLDQIEHVETGLEEQLGWQFALLLGFKAVIFGKILDRLLPWLGGDYKIWLRTFTDRRVLAWQGHSETHFRENLDLLEAMVGVAVVRGSDFDVLTPAQLAEMLTELPGGKLLKKIRLPKRFLRGRRGGGR